MKNRNLIIGVVLILIGGFWFLDNLNLIDFSVRYIFESLRQLWPLVIIFIGVNIMISNRKVENLLWLIFIAIILGYAVFLQFGGGGIPVDNNGNIVDNGGTVNGNVITYPLDNSTKSGMLTMSVGGTQFSIGSDASGKLLRIDSNLDNLSHQVNKDGSEARVNLQNEGSVVNIGDNSDRNVEVALSPSIPWSIDLSCGAVSGDLDLRELSVDDLDISVGAGKLDITVGDKAEKLDFNLDSGISEVNIYLPKDAGLKIDFEGALNSSNIGELGLIKNENEYTSSNYADADKKIEIDAQMGLGKLDFHYY